MEIIEPYKVTVFVLGFAGFLFWVQLAIMDLVGIRAKHTPGFLIEQDHDSFIFRSHRVLANSNESAAMLILFALFGIFSSANPAWLNGCALAYLAGRFGHMMFYYNNLKVARSVAFAISFCALLGMFIVGLLSWL
ncbi:MAPEG family protein [Halopseudomonas salegens]|uniref:MAPEG family protein n=1 Tax=Halopseudomonas salegens TaxID=1434072 RepID=A0A1H2HIF4_9GAMM|nr:MAPEG family protein [Halopseudomonas salegens]SDU31604.1 MAPEG family protein [Halopseudomonas salegens]